MSGWKSPLRSAPAPTKITSASAIAVRSLEERNEESSLYLCPQFLPLVQPLQRMDVTAAHENDGSLFRWIRFFTLILGEEKQCLGNRCQHFLERVVRLLIEHDLADAVDCAVADAVHVRECVAAGKALWGVNVVGLVLMFDPLVKLFACNMKSHRSFLLFSFCDRLFQLDYTVMNRRTMLHRSHQRKKV